MMKLTFKAEWLLDLTARLNASASLQDSIDLVKNAKLAANVARTMKKVKIL